MELAINTYIHLFFIIVVFCCLAVELTLTKETLPYRTIRRLTQIDGLYGFAAIAVVATGLLNWMVYGKGYEYYANNTLFILKFSLFIVVGLFSLYPTIIFIRLKKRNKEEKPEKITIPNVAWVRKTIIAELVIMFTIPLLAELMANGIDI